MMTEFLRGIARIVDLFGVIRNPSVDYILDREDVDAIAQDWRTVGDDLQWSITGSTPDTSEDVRRA